ncbi:hypothetical protein [Actinomadura algeriensis]|uniref:Cytochrome P450 n=1 Tax=Actinomadura algeriensis TaxID=1679523 RepID=A0ABR9JJZ2_9ACTN|nr:hypothetical protein [Actinomadura algeriensis]MBE1530874.1 hypothetical protein [Actinomadura algeriensis]
MNTPGLGHPGGSSVDPAAYLAALRAEFPYIGIVADFRRPIWMAVQGNHLFIRASDGFVLRQRLLELTRR